MSICARCGAAFSCGMVDDITAAPCWCTTLPVMTPQALASLRDGAAVSSCFCPACLRAAAASQAER